MKKVEMKALKTTITLAVATSMALLAGCGGENKSQATSNNDGGGDLAPASLADKTLTVQVSSGTLPFSDTGSYTFNSNGGAGTSGSYHIEGQGGVQSNIGTFTYTKSGPKTAVLVETEESNTVVHNILTFDTPTSGSIQSDIVSGGTPPGGVEAGTFTLQ